jgi:hypothetical protein
MWIWFCILFILSIISLIHSFYNYVPFFARYRFVSKLIRFIQAKKQHTFSPSGSTLQYPTTTTTTTTTMMMQERNDHDFLTDVNRRKEFVQWLQRDGVFLLHLLKSHSGEPLTIRCLENLMEIWIKNYEEKSKLAERLLTNQFRFAE